MAVRGVDSAYPPNALALSAARGYGIQLWAGYFAGRNILNGWAETDFQRAEAFGLASIAFCSGWEDPGAMRAKSALWGVPICLDVEGGIRPDGSWVQPWLDTSGAGLYGNAPVHPGRRAAFHILADYPGYDPGESWPPGLPKPSAPCAWQWQGTHIAFGQSVDSGWYDEAFVDGSLHGGGGGEITTTGGLEMYFLVDSPTIQPGSGAPIYVVFEADNQPIVKADGQPGFGRRTVRRHVTAQEWAAYSAAGAVVKPDPSKTLAGIPDWIPSAGDGSPTHVSGQFTGTLT